MNAATEEQSNFHLKCREFTNSQSAGMNVNNVVSKNNTTMRDAVVTFPKALVTTKRIVPTSQRARFHLKNKTYHCKILNKVKRKKDIAEWMWGFENMLKCAPKDIRIKTPKCKINNISHEYVLIRVFTSVAPPLTLYANTIYV